MKTLNFLALISATAGLPLALASCGTPSVVATVLEPSQETVTIEVVDSIAADDPMTPYLELSEDAPVKYLDVTLPDVLVSGDKTFAQLGNGWSADLKNIKWCSDSLLLASEEIARNEAAEDHYADLARGTSPGITLAERYVAEQIVTSYSNHCPDNVESEFGEK